jgi:hypothetical protein
MRLPGVFALLLTLSIAGRLNAQELINLGNHPVDERQGAVRPEPLLSPGDASEPAGDLQLQLDRVSLMQTALERLAAQTSSSSAPDGVQPQRSSVIAPASVEVLPAPVTTVTTQHQAFQGQTFQGQALQGQTLQGLAVPQLGPLQAAAAAGKLCKYAYCGNCGKFHLFDAGCHTGIGTALYRATVRDCHGCLHCKTFLAFLFKLKEDCNFFYYVPLLGDPCIDRWAFAKCPEHCTCCYKIWYHVAGEAPTCWHPFDCAERICPH